MRRLCTTLALTAGLVTGLPVAAQAATLRISDATDDVRVVTVTDDGDTVDEPAPDAGPDIVATTVTHSRSRVEIRVELADLEAPTDDEAFGLAFRLFGPQRNQAREVVSVDTVDGSLATVSRPSGRTTCGPRKVRSSFDYVADVAIVSFARTCVGSPSKIRVAGGALQLDALSGDDEVTTYDDALESASTVDTFGTSRSAWVRRG